jgi:hypothetical protein
MNILDHPWEQIFFLSVFFAIIVRQRFCFYWQIDLLSPINIKLKIIRGRLNVLYLDCLYITALGKIIT